jgi:hypothetical protein
MQQRPVPVAAGDGDLARMSCEQLVEIAGAAIRGGGDDLSVDARGVDMRLQGAPARETVVAGDRELRLVQLRRRVARAHRVELLLGCLLQPVDMGVSRE